MTPPLARVLEFGSYLAGPLVGKHLADLGCEVVAVRRPPHARGAAREARRMAAMYPDLDEAKTRVVTLDLTTEDGQEEAKRLVQQADVLVENFAPGVLDRLGFSFQSCLALQPDLLYVSLPGFVEEDTKTTRTTRTNAPSPPPAWDSVLMASAGVFCDMGYNRTLLGVQASFSGLPLASAYGATFATLAVACALHDGTRGIHVRVPLGSALAECLVHNSLQFPKDPRHHMDLRQRRLHDGTYPLASKEELEDLLDPFFCKYPCRDGRTVYLVCPSHARHQLAALRVLGVEEDVLRLVPRVDPYGDEDGDERNHGDEDERNHGIGADCLSPSQARLVRPLLRQAFLRRTSWEWEEALGEAGVPAVVHRTTEEWCTSPHATRSGLCERRATDGSLRLAPLSWMEEEDANPPLSSFPRTLRGVRVLDLTNVIAGPTIGAMLARMGADVIKVDPPRPTYAPGVSVVYGLAANVGKRSVLLDVLTPAGRQALEALLRTADLLLVNCTRACLQRLQLTREDLARTHPHLLLLRFDAWGGPREDGPLAERVGYDDNVQAATGIMARFGGSLADAEEHAHIGTIDTVSGVAGAAAAVFALLRRREQGLVGTVRTSLAAVAQYVQYPFVCGAVRPQCGRGLDCRGEHALHRCYRTKDGHVLLVACLAEEEVADVWPSVRDALGILACVDDGYDDDSSSLSFSSRIVRTLESHLATRSSADVCRTVAAVALCRMDELRARCLVPRAQLDGSTFQFQRQADHPIGDLTMVCPVAVRMPGVILSSPPSPKYGAHTAAILAEVGCTKALLLTGSAAVAWSRTYLPFATPCDACDGRHHRLLVLACGHRVCRSCLASPRCPRCGLSHEMDVLALRTAVVHWRAAYQSWRTGQAKGGHSSSRSLVAALTGHGTGRGERGERGEATTRVLLCSSPSGLSPRRRSTLARIRSAPQISCGVY